MKVGLLRRFSMTSVALMLGLTVLTPARADGVASFYKGKTVSIVIGSSAGGGYDLYSRLLARYLGKYIPGNPTVIPQNMPGAGSLKAAKYIYEIAPKDGTVFGTFNRTAPLGPLVGTPGATFDSRKFTWLGSMAKDVTLCITSAKSGIATWDDALKTNFIVGGEGPGADADVLTNVIKNIFHAKAKLVTGYPGTADMFLATERGELAGFCGVSYSTVVGRWGEQLKAGKIKIILQGAFQKNPEIADVPNMLDLVTDAHQKGLMRFILAPQEIARPFAAPPGIPADRAQALREAFAATLKDPELLAEAKKLQVDIGLVPASEVQALFDELYQEPKEMAAEVAKAFGM
jgi:tripartite-type tricarboxylate transporter receptor subunit TctC